MAKIRTEYQCQDCGAASRQWAGQCGTCGAWNSLVEAVATVSQPTAGRGYAGQLPTRAKLGQIAATTLVRLPSGMAELDRVLGGGFVPGSVVLLGGAPGAGKSTLLLQVATHLTQNTPCLYVTGEESLEQIALRASRLGLSATELD